jgi:K+-transporting ATPase ATPase C chain
MLKHARIAVKLGLITLLIMGIIYPLFITALSQVLFPARANGGLIKVSSQVIGSELIGQRFSSPRYFHPRPSASRDGYDPTASGGSNLGPTSRQLIERVSSDVIQLTKDNPSLKGRIPSDMVTTSASGLDPHISPANAYLQAPRIARARGMSLQEVKKLIKENTAKRDLGFLGEPRVNVLMLNMALDERTQGNE